MARGKKGFDPSKYTEVKDRLKWYQEQNPDYRVETEVITWTPNNDSIIIKAYLYRNAEEQEKRTPHATGLAEELRGAGFVNDTSHVENCETSAIGRALANVNFHGSDKRPSKEEMDKVTRTKQYNKEKEEAPEPDAQVEDVDSDDYDAVLAAFTKPEAVVEWFNTELDKRDGKEKEEFKNAYMSKIKDRASELYAKTS